MPCMGCGEPAESTRCYDCTPEHRANSRAGLRTDRPTTSPRVRGYGSGWDKLSAQARRMQPWCSACGAREDLTTDHSEEAWRRHDAGKPIRLCDVDVLCRRCNARKGRARPGGQPPRGGTGLGGGEPRRPLHTPGGYPAGGGAA